MDLNAANADRILEVRAGRAGIKTVLKDNAARGVGGTKFGADAMLGFGGSPIMIGVSGLYIAARLILMAFGTTALKQNTPDGKVAGYYQTICDKIVPPVIKTHPVETASFLGTLAALGFIAEGVVNKQPVSIAVGLLAVAGETVIWAKPYFDTRRDLQQENAADILAAEKDKERPLPVHIRKNRENLWQKTKRYITDMKDQPVRLGSNLLALSSVAVLVNGLLLGNAAYILAGIMYIVANLAQGQFVDKNLTGQKVTLPETVEAALPSVITEAVEQAATATVSAVIPKATSID